MTEVDDLSLISIDFYIVAPSGFQQTCSACADTGPLREGRGVGLAARDHATRLSYTVQIQRVDVNMRHRGKDGRT
jgi:hypothetical protein